MGTPCTPPTPDEVYGYLPLIGGRVSIAMNEILRLMKFCLPDSIAFINAKCGYTDGIPIPQSYRMAPEKLTKNDINSVLVGCSVGLPSEGAGQFKAVSNIQLYSINQPVTDREQVMDQWDRLWVMAAILRPSLGGWTDPAGRTVWNNLRPTAITALPQAWEDYSGVGITYEMTQYPYQSNLWTPDV